MANMRKRSNPLHQGLEMLRVTLTSSLVPGKELKLQPSPVLMLLPSQHCDMFFDTGSQHGSGVAALPSHAPATIFSTLPKILVSAGRSEAGLMDVPL